MHTQCNAEQLEFAGVERRRVVAAFDGGMVSSDAGALLLGRADEAIGLIDRLAGCFVDSRDPGLIEHSVRTLVGQRVFGMALGYRRLSRVRHNARTDGSRSCNTPRARAGVARGAWWPRPSRPETNPTPGSS